MIDEHIYQAVSCLPQLIPCNSFPKPGFLRRVFHIKGIGSSVNPPKLYNLMKYVYFLGDSLDKSTGTHRRQHLALIFGVNSRARNVWFQCSRHGGFPPTILAGLRANRSISLSADPPEVQGFKGVPLTLGGWKGRWCLYRK